MINLQLGVGTKLGVLTSRLARIIDRARVVEELLQKNPDHAEDLETELEELYQRSHLINRAITLSTTTGLLVCLVIALLFTGDATGLALDKWIAALFVGGIFSLIGSFIYFMREIFVATKTLTRQRELGRSKIIARDS